MTFLNMPSWECADQLKEDFTDIFNTSLASVCVSDILTVPKRNQDQQTIALLAFSTLCSLSWNKGTLLVDYSSGLTTILVTKLQDLRFNTAPCSFYTACTEKHILSGVLQGCVLCTVLFMNYTWLPVFRASTASTLLYLLTVIRESNDTAYRRKGESWLLVSG